LAFVITSDLLPPGYIGGQRQDGERTTIGRRGTAPSPRAQRRAQTQLQPLVHAGTGLCNPQFLDSAFFFTWTRFTFRWLHKCHLGTAYSGNLQPRASSVIGRIPFRISDSWWAVSTYDELGGSYLTDPQIPLGRSHHTETLGSSRFLDYRMDQRVWLAGFDYLGRTTRIAAHFGSHTPVPS
jgi:hypothetical protein